MHAKAVFFTDLGRIRLSEASVFGKAQDTVPRYPYRFYGRKNDLGEGSKGTIVLSISERGGTEGGDRATATCAALLQGRCAWTFSRSRHGVQ